MSALMVPTVRQIVAQVEVVLRHDPEAQVVGIRSTRANAWPERLPVQGREFTLAWCASPLAIRERMVAQEGAAEGGLVVLTPLTDQEVGCDVLARLARGRVFAVDAWEMVRNAFQAREIDARLARWSWVAEALLETQPVGGYPPVPGGFLDADTAWTQVLRSTLGLGMARPDLTALMQWSLAPDAARRWAALSEVAQRQVVDWLDDGFGGSPGGSPSGLQGGSIPSGVRLAVACIRAGAVAELAPLGWICGILFGEGERSSTPELLAAAVRLERFTGGLPVRAPEGRQLHQAAIRLDGLMEGDRLQPVREYADRLVSTLHIEPFVGLSDDLPRGFDARLRAFAEALTRYLDAPGGAAAAVHAAQAVQAAWFGVKRHRLAARQAARTGKVEMAARLVRWLETPLKSPVGLGEAMLGFASEGSFVDRARYALVGGDESVDLSAACARLGAAVRVRREQANRDFARLLRDWNEAGCPVIDGLVPVERVLQEVVAPLAERTPVLLLVVDGLSFAIFRELLEDAARQGWFEMVPPGREAPLVGVATLPSITEVSRSSLFCGRLTLGQASVERQAFAQHPALVGASRPSARPALFHKGDLAQDGRLSDAVRDAVGARDTRVVAVVFNGVDDHLSGADQLAHRWGLDDLRLINPLLFEARAAGRVVVLTADHGHVREDGTALRPGDEGDRWRGDAAPAGEGEVMLSGGRVVTVDGRNRGIFPWSESIRYGGKKNGYHGGVSLQEMAIPICLLTTQSSTPEGYALGAPIQPAWWEELAPATPTTPTSMTPITAVAPVAARRKRAPDPRREPDLLAGLPEAVVPATSTQATSEDCVGRLLASPVFASQRQLAARAALRDEEVRALLEALSERGGKVSKTALAQRLGMPGMRVSGFVNAARRMLNVDQAAVLTLDETEGVVVLNRELLKVQFQVGPC